MSYSSDSLKKKVCVTVFLDELFEEVWTDDGDRTSQHGNLSTSKLVVSNADHAVAPTKSRSRNSPIPVEITPQEKPKTLQKELNKPREIDSRPRKHRRESKFSKNPCKLLKSREVRRPLESGISESDAEDRLLLNCSPKKNEKNSVSDFSKVSPPKKDASSKMICSATKVTRLSSQSLQKSSLDSQYDIVLYNSKSTQVDRGNVETLNIDRMVGDSVSLLEEEQKQIVEDLAWRKTQRQIQLILAKAKNWYEVKEACEGDRIRRYDLRSILEECEKAEEQGCLTNRKTYSMTWSTDFYDSDTKDLSDSYTCVFPHNRHHPGLKASRLKRVTNKQLGRDGFESDLSEVECISYEENSQSMNYKHLLCYTSCIDCEQDAFQKDSNKDEENAQSISEDTPPDKSLESFKSKTSQITNESDEKAGLVQIYSNAPAAEPDVDSEVKSIDGILNKFDSATQYDGILWNPSENRRKTSIVEFERKGNKRSEVLFCLESKEKLLICEEILKRVGETVEGPKKIIIAPKEIEILAPYDKKGNQILNSTQGIAEVFIKKEYDTVDRSKILSEAESEMIFADSDNGTETKDLFTDLSICTTPSEEGRKVRILEFEDELTGSKILRRMETVEILGDCSDTGMRNISAEVILICENISNQDVCLEAWQSSASSLKSLPEIGECYLKDSKDSSMYLIEIPFHFKRAKKQTILDE